MRSTPSATPSVRSFPPSRGLDDSRLFGTHARLGWWRPLVVLVTVPIVMIVLQIALYGVAGLIEGSVDPLSPQMTPLKLLAANLAIALTGVLAIALVAALSGVPWRRLLASPRRFDWRRVGSYAGVAAVLVAAALGVVALVDPSAPGWVGFGVTTTTVAFLVVTLLTTPLQAAGEELMLRGAALPAASSWLRNARAAFVLGAVVSAVLFAVLHASSDPWFNAYYLVFGVTTALMALVSRGLEAPIAFHVANNVLVTSVNTLLADGEPFTIDRGAGAGGPAVLLPAAAAVAMVAVVWLVERRRR